MIGGIQKRVDLSLSKYADDAVKCILGEHGIRAREIAKKVANATDSVDMVMKDDGYAQNKKKPVTMLYLCGRGCHLDRRAIRNGEVSFPRRVYDKTKSSGCITCATCFFFQLTRNNVKKQHDEPTDHVGSFGRRRVCHRKICLHRHG